MVSNTVFVKSILTIVVVLVVIITLLDLGVPEAQTRNIRNVIVNQANEKDVIFDSLASTVYRSTHFLSAEGYDMRQVLQGSQVKISADGHRILFTVKGSPSSAYREFNHGEIVLFEKSWFGKWQNRGVLFACDEDRELSILSFDTSGTGNTVVVRCFTDTDEDLLRVARTEVFVLDNFQGSSKWKSQRITSVSGFCENNPRLSFALSFHGETLAMASVELAGTLDQCVRKTRVLTQGSSGLWREQFENVDTFNYQSNEVALSGDGKTFAQIGAKSDSSYSEILVFRFSSISESWIAQSPVLVNQTVIGKSNNIGYTIMLSHDGNVLLVNSLNYYHGDTDMGRGLVFTKPHQGEWRHSWTLTVNDKSTIREVGGTMAMSSTGNVIILCGQMIMDQTKITGACWLFSRNNSTEREEWKQEGKYLSKPDRLCPRCNSLMFGWSIHMTPNGHAFVVGGFAPDWSGGGVEIFERVTEGHVAQTV